MKNQVYNYAAAWTLVGSVAVVCGRRSQALSVWALCQVKQKTSPAGIPLNLTTKQRLVLKGFFTSIAAVTTTIDSLLKSAGCGVKIGWCMPLTASLAALVKRLHNLTTPKRQNGLYEDELTRSAHLALITSNAGGAGSQEPFRLFAPLINYL